MKQLTREEKIEAIYEKIANKELGPGCIIRYKGHLWDDVIVGTLKDVHGSVGQIPECNFGGMNTYKSKHQYNVFTDNDEMKKHIHYRRKYEKEIGYNHFALYKNINDGGVIKGHPVMIGDVLHWYKKNHSVRFYQDFRTRDEICQKWDNERKPIDNQPDDCINFIHSLLGYGQERS